MTTWLLDTNVLVQAHRRDYAMDFCPAFWDWLDYASEQGKVFSLERVALGHSRGGFCHSEANQNSERMHSDERSFCANGPNAATGAGVFRPGSTTVTRRGQVMN
jgi:hypothetical protein